MAKWVYIGGVKSRVSLTQKKKNLIVYPTDTRLVYILIRIRTIKIFIVSNLCRVFSCRIISSLFVSCQTDRVFCTPLHPGMS